MKPRHFLLALSMVLVAVSWLLPGLLGGAVALVGTSFAAAFLLMNHAAETTAAGSDEQKAARR